MGDQVGKRAENPEQFKYYLDGKKDYVVPKRKLEDIVTYF